MKDVSKSEFVPLPWKGAPVSQIAKLKNNSNNCWVYGNYIQLVEPFTIQQTFHCRVPCRAPCSVDFLCENEQISATRVSIFELRHEAIKFYILVKIIYGKSSFSTSKKQTNYNHLYPIFSMYSIFTYIWVIYGVNVGKYASTMEHMGTANGLFCVHSKMPGCRWFHPYDPTALDRSWTDL